MDNQVLSELRDERAQLLAEGVDLSMMLGVSLAQDAMALGAKCICVEAGLRPWMLVGADRDWISSATLSVAEAFDNMMLWPGTSKYFRSEVRVFAFASAVCVWKEGVVHRLSGGLPPQDVCEAASKYAFTVGFNCG